MPSPEKLESLPARHWDRNLFCDFDSFQSVTSKIARRYKRFESKYPLMALFHFHAHVDIHSVISDLYIYFSSSQVILLFKLVFTNKSMFVPDFLSPDVH